MVLITLRENGGCFLLMEQMCLNMAAYEYEKKLVEFLRCSQGFLWSPLAVPLR